MKTAAAYIRVSTDDQIEYSPESQIKAIKEYAKRNDIILLNDYIFQEDGISGKSTKRRPEFQRMIGIAKSKPKPFDCILLWKFSRFARNREDSIVYKSMLRKQLGIDVISISENIGDDKMSILIEALIEAMDEYYSINLAEEVKRGMTEKAKRGEPQTIAPFGYEIHDKQFFVNESEQEIVKMIFDDFINGMGYLDIAKKINAMGVRTHRGNKFENRTIEYIIRNPVYIGKLRWNPTERSRRNFDHPDLVIADGTHEPIIDEDTWNQAQAKVAERKGIYRRYYKPQYMPKHWLVGLLECGDCHGALVKQTTSFQCNNYVRGKCTSHSVYIKKMERIVLEELADVIKNRNVPNVEIINKKTDNNNLFQKQLDNAEKKLLRVKEAFEAGIDTIEEYKNNKLRITKEIEKIKQQMITPRKKNKIDINPLIEKIKKSYDILISETATNEEKSLSITGYIKKIIFDKADNKFIFTYYLSE